MACWKAGESSLCLGNFMGMGWRRPSLPAGGSRTGVQAQPWLKGRAEPKHSGSPRSEGWPVLGCTTSWKLLLLRDSAVSRGTSRLIQSPSGGDIRSSGHGLEGWTQTSSRPQCSHHGADAFNVAVVPQVPTNVPCPCVQLSVQNQELIEKNLTLQERLRQAQLTAQPLPADTARLAQELHGELASCLQDLQSVYSIVTQRAQGKDPNLSLLLGIHCKYRAMAGQTLPFLCCGRIK